MKTRTALVAAIACGAAAVLLVAADLAFNVDATLEVRGADGSWTTVGRLREPYAAAPTPCGDQFRLHLHNGLPWGTTTQVTVLASGASPQAKTLLDEPWSLGAGASRDQEFQVPASAFEAAGPGGAPVKSGYATVQVLLGHSYARTLTAQACPAEAAA